MNYGKKSPAASSVLKYLEELEGNGILTGQHTQTMKTEELSYIGDITGEQPALCGFELLSYSPNIRYDSAMTEECRVEVEENRGTLELAIDYAKRTRSLITLTYHWFSPTGGSDKSFFSCHTEFDTSAALREGTPENEALLSDIDSMARLLYPLREADIPVLWRPFHEADGRWFWWARNSGAEAAELFRRMRTIMTEKHGLDNLIWVWNSPQRADYPGDECADIISRDMYPPAHEHTAQTEALEELRRITDSRKLCAIAETGVVPDVEAMRREKSRWLWFMTWSKEFALTENYTTNEMLRRAYSDEYAVTLRKLPQIY